MKHHNCPRSPPRYVLFNDGTATRHDDPETNMIRVQRLELEHHKEQLKRKYNSLTN